MNHLLLLVVRRCSSRVPFLCFRRGTNFFNKQNSINTWHTPVRTRHGQLLRHLTEISVSRRIKHTSSSLELLEMFLDLCISRFPKMSSSFLRFNSSLRTASVSLLCHVSRLRLWSVTKLMRNFICFFPLMFPVLGSLL
jgi:hypothetical protein